MVTWDWAWASSTALSWSYTSLACLLAFVVICRIVIYLFTYLPISVALLGKASSIAIVSVDFNIMQGFILRLRCARLKDLTGLWFHNFLRSILKVLRLLKNICQFSTCWTSFDVLAFHNFGQNFFTAKALEILRQMLSQYRTFIQAY